MAGEHQVRILEAPTDRPGGTSIGLTDDRPLVGGLVRGRVVTVYGRSGNLAERFRRMHARCDMRAVTHGSGNCVPRAASADSLVVGRPGNTSVE